MVNIETETAEGEIFPVPPSTSVGAVAVEAEKPWKLELCCIEHTLEKHHCLPRNFVWVAWAISLSLMLTFSITLISYGFRFNRAKSLNWIGSVGWAVIESIFILQPIKVFIAYLILLYKRRIRVSLVGPCNFIFPS